MDGSRLTMLSQVNNSIDYGGECFPYQQVSPFLEYPRTNWYSSQSDQLPPSSSPSCSIPSSSSSSSSAPLALLGSSFNVPSQFSSLLSSPLLSDHSDFSINYPPSIVGNGTNNCAGGLHVPFPIDDVQQITSASSTGSGHFSWENLSSPINYHHHHYHHSISHSISQPPCWPVNGITYESECERKPSILPPLSSFQNEYDVASMQLVNRGYDVFLNDCVEEDRQVERGRGKGGGRGGDDDGGGGGCEDEEEDVEDEEDEEDEDDVDEDEDEDEDYGENFNSDDNEDDNQLVIDTSASSGAGSAFKNLDQKECKSGESVKFCQVCGDKSTGRHYNAFTCEGCKGFFRRSVMKGMKYACKSNTENCSVDASNRRKCCRFCRYMRCIKVGMNPDICLNKANDDGVERNSRANSLECMFDNLSWYYNEFLKPLMCNYIELIDPGSCDQFYISYIQFHFRVTNKLIYFESRLPPFTDLPPETRYFGVREAAHSVAILFILLHFDPETVSVLWPNGRQITEDQLKGSVFSGIRFTMFQLARELKRHNIIEEELPLMVLVLLTLTFSREQFASTVITKCGANKHHAYWNGHLELLHKLHNFIGIIKNALNNFTVNYNRDYNPIVHHHFPYPSQSSTY